MAQRLAGTGATIDDLYRVPEHGKAEIVDGDVMRMAPAGFLMGFGFPTGMRLAQAADSRPTPWFWGINGAAGVLASVLAVAMSLSIGINATIICGALCYLALIPAARAMVAGTGMGHQPDLA